MKHQTNLDQQRKRVFSCVRSIKMIDSTQKLTENEVLMYLKNVKGLNFGVERLNDLTGVELSHINRQLDCIKSNTQKQRRKAMKISFEV